MISKRFVIRKSLIGKNVVVEFTNKKGDTIKYNHDKVYSIMKDKLEENSSSKINKEEIID